jgi:hypothetical protein
MKELWIRCCTVESGTILAVAFLSLCLSFPAMGQGSAIETVDVVGQGGAGPVVSTDGATLVRVKNGITISLNMPTPAPGSYAYPPPNAFQPTVVVGHPEVFTGWAFVFNYPDLCSDGVCGSNDIGAGTAARGGVYNIAGQVAGGGRIQLAGNVSEGDTPFGGAAHAPLENPTGAEVHVAVAPHGMLQPDLLPGQIQTPIGSPPFWWLAFFIP